MATVENVHLDITASATKPGYSDIAYSYELHPSELDCEWKRVYKVQANLWGEDLLDNDILSTRNDQHTVSFDGSEPCEPRKISRVFEVETKVLDEDMFGDDEVFLMVEASTGLGSDAAGEDPVMGRSNTVVGDF